MKRKFYYGWVILAIGFLTIICGYVCRNTFSVFYPAIVDEFGWTRGNTGLIFSVNSLMYGLFAPVAGVLVDRFRTRYVLAAGALLIGIGMALCSIATTTWQFIILYGAVAGIGLSIAGWVPVSTLVANWFVRRRALAFGILGAGLGISYLSAYIAQHVIASFGWQTAYIAIGVFIALLIVPLSIVFVRRTPAEKRSFPDGMKAEQSLPASSSLEKLDARTDWQKNEWTLRAAAHTRQFWLMFAIFATAMGIVEQLAISHQVYFYIDAGYDALSASKFYGLFGICFAIGNLLGALSDRIGRERFFISTALVCTAFVSLLFLMKDTSMPWLPPLIAIGFGLTFGSYPCVLNATLADLFHGRHYGRIAGVMVLGFALGGTLSAWLAGHIHDLTGSYTGTYVMIVAALLATAIMMWFVAPRKVSPVGGR